MDGTVHLSNSPPRDPYMIVVQTYAFPDFPITQKAMFVEATDHVRDVAENQIGMLVDSLERDPENRRITLHVTATQEEIERFEATAAAQLLISRERLTEGQHDACAV
jgi:hypothetical protein